jgi:hypothetical protein
MDKSNRLRLPLRALGKAVGACGVDASAYGKCIAKDKALAPQACGAEFAKVRFNN